MNPISRAYLELHIAVILFGFTAILGKLINLDAFELVWWRVLITSVSLFFLIRFGTRLKHVSRKRILQYLGIGVLVALHWVSFFGSIKFANASITLVCMATTSFFTAFSEPMIMRYKPRKYEILLGLAIIPAMLFIVDLNDLGIRIGVLLGLLSAFLASLFGSLNKKYVHDADSMTITFLELSSAWLFLSLCLPFIYAASPREFNLMPVGNDWAYLIILALACTTLAYVLALRSLKVISAFAANLVVNLEPVYGILLAIIILQEHHELSPRFYFGFVIIIGIILSFPYFRKKYQQ
jgi:drug/metabolite transporter (DMT)-like permease